MLGRYPGAYSLQMNSRELRFDRHLSGLRDLISPVPPVSQLIRRALPPFRYVIRENMWMFKNGYQGRYMPLMQELISESWPHPDFAAAGQDAFSMVSLLYFKCGGTRVKDGATMVCQVSVWPSRTIVYLADAAAVKVSDTIPRSISIRPLVCFQEVTAYSARFPKPIELYKVLSVFGNNIIASEGEEWKRYRRITAPAFSEVCNGCRRSRFLNMNSREILGWYGTKRSGSCLTCSTMSGETAPK